MAHEVDPLVEIGGQQDDYESDQQPVQDHLSEPTSDSSADEVQLPLSKPIIRTPFTTLEDYRGSEKLKGN